MNNGTVRDGTLFKVLNGKLNKTLVHGRKFMSLKENYPQAPVTEQNHSVCNDKLLPLGTKHNLNNI